MAEALKLKIHEIFEGKCDDSLLVENAVAAIVYLSCRVPGVNGEHARGSTMQTEAHDLRTVKIWNVTEPFDEIGAAGDAGVNFLDFVPVPQKSNPAELAKEVRFQWLAKRRRARFPDLQLHSCRRVFERSGHRFA